MENAEKEKEIYKEYRDTLQTLTVNSKPLIDVLTEVADENKNYAHVIAQCIEDQLENVSLNLKLPILYLIDSIIKSPATWQSYTRLFFPKLIPMFVRIYKESKDEVRTKLSKLRFTWSGVLPFEILEVLDKIIRKINPAWQAAPQAHINPLFIQNTAATRMIASTNSTAKAIPVTEESLKQLRALKHKRLELEKELKMLRSKQPVNNANALPKSAPKDVPTAGTSVAKVAPASCIAPVSNESVNTTITRRVRDPRLRKIEQDEGTLIKDKAPIMPATTVKDSKPAVTTVQVDYKVDKENVLLADTATKKNGVPSPPKNTSNAPRVPPVPLTEAESPPAPAIDRSVDSNANDDSNTRSRGRLKKKELSSKPDVKSKIKVRVETTNKNTEKNSSELSPEKNANSPVKSKDTRSERGVSGSSVKPANSKLKFMVERWASCDEEKKRKFIDEMSKVNPKTTAKFVKLLEKKKKFNRIPKINPDATRTATVIDTINVEDTSIDETKRESAAKTTDNVKLTNCKDVSSCADMDVDTGIATNVRASTNKSSGTDEKSPSIVNDLTDQRCENEKKRNDENDRLRMEMQKLEQEEKNLEADIQKCTTEIKEQSSLSEQLEAVMNATSSQKADTFSHGIDIRTLLPVVVNEMISAAPFTAAPAAVEAVPSFNNPFGLAQPIKDVDYRQLFAAFPQPQPAVAPSLRACDDALPASKVDRVETVDDAFTSSPRRRRNTDSDEESNSKVKRRRTTNDTCNNDDYDSSQFSNDSDNDSGGDTKAKRRRREDAPALDSLANVETQARNDAIMTPTSELPQPPMFPIFGFPMMNPNFNVISSTKPEVPEANYDILRMIERDPTKEMDLFGKRREVRHYGTTAVIFLNWDDPRQVTFYNGQRTIIIDNNIKIRCDLNRPDVEKMVYGRPHRFRLGTPTRELYIDGIGYECCFNGPPIQVRFGDVLRSVSLVGREPGKDIGKCKRTDLVAGKINIIIDEEFAFPVFLDSKPQSIIIDGLPFVIMFIDALKRIVINDVPFAAEFGGLSQSFKFRNKVHCFRLTSLPVGIVPGSINIFQMVMTKLPLPPPLPPSLQYPALTSTATEPPKPQPNILQNLDIDELFQKLVASGVVPSSSSSTVADAKSNENGEEIIKTVDFEKPETLKQKQPVLVSKLYSGVQCSSCGLRFSCDQAVKYDQHLDWHFRLNRKSKSGTRVISSRKWYYNSQDWMKFQEMEDVDDREQNWFENNPVGKERDEENKEEIPCVVVGENDQNACCDLCKDRFEQFYNQDVEEWLLRNAIRVETALYHPLCYKDYQERDDHSDVEEIVEAIEPINVDDITVVEENVIALDDTSVVDKSDDSVPVQESQIGVEADAAKELVTIKQEKPDSHTATIAPRAVELNVPKESNEDETDSDVEEVELIEQPIEQIVINDDYDDIEESNLETLHSEDIVEAENEEIAANRDEASVEPVIGDEHVIEDDDARHSPTVDIMHCVSNIVSIDGNIDMGESMPPMNTTTKIKINITKIRAESKSPPPSTVAAKQPESDETKSADSNAELNALSSETSVDRQLSSSVEKLTASDTKEKLKSRNLTEYPPVSKGTETSGLCSIM